MEVRKHIKVQEWIMHQLLIGVHVIFIYHIKQEPIWHLYQDNISATTRFKW